MYLRNRYEYPKVTQLVPRTENDSNAAALPSSKLVPSEFYSHKPFHCFPTGDLMSYMFKCNLRFFNDWVGTMHLHQTLLRTWENDKEITRMLKIALADNARGRTDF
jgi:hypothetical protein